MLQGKVNTALRLLDKQESGGVAKLTGETINQKAERATPGCHSSHSGYEDDRRKALL